MDRGTASAHTWYMAEVAGFVVPRTILLDQRGTALRLSWHPAEAVAVLSLWREDRCIGTFRAAPSDMAGIISFLSESLASAAVEPGHPLSDAG